MFFPARRPLRSLFRMGLYVTLSIILAGLLAMAVEPTTTRAANTTINTCDFATLSNAITNAASGDTLSFGCSGTIIFTSPISISKNLTLDATGQAVVLDGNNTVGLFSAFSGILGLSHLTIQNGFVASGGGAIYSLSGLNLDTVVVQNNHATGWGGAIAVYGATNVVNSTFLNNSTGGDGGALNFNGTLQMLTVTGSTFSNNHAVNGGAAIEAYSGPISISSSNFTNNSTTSDIGGALKVNSSDVTLKNVSFSGNQAPAASGGAIGLVTGQSNSVTAINTTIGNSTGGNCNTAIINGSGSTDDDNTCFPVPVVKVDHYTVSGFPSPVNTGTPGGITLQAVDSSNTVVTGYTGTVHFTSSDAQAMLPADYTFTAADNGSHTFSGITLNTTGTQSITATDTKDPSISGTQSGIVVNQTIRPPTGAAGYSSNPAPGSTVEVGKAKPGKSVRTDIVVSESGSTTLTVSNPVISGSNAADFSLVSPVFPFEIADGGAARGITVACTPKEVGARTAILTLSTNDPDRPTVSYSLWCKGYAEQEEIRTPADLSLKLRVTPDRLVSVSPATEISYTITVANLGAGESSPSQLVLPIDPNLALGYTHFSDGRIWVSELVNSGLKAYVKVSLPAMQSGQSFVVTLIFRPAASAQVGAVIRSRVSIGWDDSAGTGKSSQSNTVHFSLSDGSSANESEGSDGSIQRCEQDGATVEAGKVFTLTDSLYSSNELVSFWYTDSAGHSVALGSQQADKDGKISFEFQTAGLAPGSYVLNGRGNRSLLTGTAVITIK